MNTDSCSLFTSHDFGEDTRRSSNKQFMFVQKLAYMSLQYWHVHASVRTRGVLVGSDASVIIMDVNDASAVIKSKSLLTLHPFDILFLHTIGLTYGFRR